MSSTPRAWCSAIVACLAATAPSPLPAQTIINIERLQPQDVTGWHASVGGAFSVSGGNDDHFDLSTGFALGYRWAPHWIRLFTGLEYRAEDGASTTDNRYAHLRYGYEFSRWWRTFHFAQLQQNQSLLLQERALLGSGVRRTLFRTERTLVDIGTGAMYERELLDAEQLQAVEAAESRTWRMANLFVVSRQFRHNLRLIGVGYLQPDLGDLDDFRALTDLSFLVGLGPMVDLTLRFEWRHDSRPPTGIERGDYLFETGVVFSLR
jgi:putative salt-induced outer membrane protein